MAEALDTSAAEAAGLRPGSKKHRVYKAVAAALARGGSATVDELILVIEPLGVFGAVTNKRSNVANILSQLKAKKLLMSDHRGNWFLNSGSEPDPAFKSIVWLILENLCPDCRRRAFDALVARYKTEIEEFGLKHAELRGHREHLAEINAMLVAHGVDVEALEREGH